MAADASRTRNHLLLTDSLNQSLGSMANHHRHCRCTVGRLHFEPGSARYFDATRGATNAASASQLNVDRAHRIR